jgi:hypothetical protein
VGSAGQVTAYADGTQTVAASFDPSQHTIAEVQDYVTANPDQASAVRAAELAGKNRSTLLAWLDQVIGS